MPIKRCKNDGKNGWKYGDQGTCYTGKGAKRKAIKQGLAIQYNGGPDFESRGEVEPTDEEEKVDDVQREIMDFIYEK